MQNKASPKHQLGAIRRDYPILEIGYVCSTNIEVMSNDVDFFRLSIAQLMLGYTCKR
ncbi:MAG: hypothetical protein HN356_05750 [Calditrichaeota bacterium]|nr:hypothetical protein [Calditrichota bacterium]MBT7790691.1 hypothetical protein [Calditrichota bacterium]